jgi:hypothetical protein
MNANPSDKNTPSGEPSNPASEEKIREFCFGLALALRRITGRKIEQGTDELPKMIEDAIDAANGTELTKQSGRSQE